MKRNHLYIGVLVLTLLIYLAVKWAQPQPIDWTESYSGADKIPYGTYITRRLLPDLFPGQQIRYRRNPIYGTLDSTDYQNALFINARFSPDKFETGKLVKHVRQGKTIFIAAKAIKGPLADTLDIATAGAPVFSPSDIVSPEDSTQLSFTHPRSGQQRWYYPAQLGYYHFTDYDTASTAVLGINGQQYANYIKVSRGKGAFYLHTVPYIFTNYYMRQPHYAGYAFRALSHLPVAPTVWDEYYKEGRVTNRSPLRYIVSQPYLRGAWITTLLALFLFILFRSKRRERIIPPMPKPRNTTVEFAKTIGRLYHQSGDHKNIAEKKIRYFMEYIREELNLVTDTLDEQFIRRVARRSGVEVEQTKNLFKHIRRIRNQPEIGSNELRELNHQIETFYQQSSR